MKKKLSFLFIIAIFFFFVAEIALRLLPNDGYQRNVYERNRQVIQFDFDHIQYDPILGFKLKENITFEFNNREFETTINTNSSGIRDSQPKLMKHLFLGDSFFFGWGVNEKERFDQSFENSYNLAMSGYGNLQSLLSLKEFLKQNKTPEKIYISFFRNDWNDNVSWGAYPTYIPGGGSTNRSNSMYKEWKDISKNIGNSFLTKHSRIFDLLKVKYREITNYNDQIQERIDQLSPPPLPSAHTFSKILQELNSLSLKQLVWVIIPSKDELNNNWSDTSLEAMDSIKAHQFSYIKLDSILTLDDYYELDDHWNKNGHKKVGEYLSKYE